MPEEPVFGHREAWVFLERANQELRVPEHNSAMGKRGASDLAREQSLQAREFVLQILSLLAPSSAASVCTYRGYSVSEAFYAFVEPVSDDGKVRREQTIVVD